MKAKNVQIGIATENRSAIVMLALVNGFVWSRLSSEGALLVHKGVTEGKNACSKWSVGKQKGGEE